MQPSQPDQPPTQPPAGTAAQFWVAPQFPLPPKPPDPPNPWVLTTADPGPWGNLKPNIAKEPTPFKGESGDIACFFSQCDMYFSIFNQYFHHHPHKVIFCASCFKDEALTRMGTRSTLTTLSLSKKSGPSSGRTQTLKSSTPNGKSSDR